MVETVLGLVIAITVGVLVNRSLKKLFSKRKNKRMEKESYVGIGFILFGIFVGGVGVATAGFGIGIPMIPIGIYLVWRGFARKKLENEREDPFAVEKSSGGKVGLGIILILVGLATSALIIGIPILLYGIYMIYTAVKPKLQEGAVFEYQCAERIRENTKNMRTKTFLQKMRLR